MKFVCDGLVLSDAAITVSKACATKTIKPVMECVKLSAENDVLTLLAYDGEISIEKKIPVEVMEEGEICVNGKLFSDFINKVSSFSLVIGTCDKGLEIRYADSESYMQTLPEVDFPLVKNDVAGSAYFEVKEADLKELISKAVFCCATEDSRPILKGCLLETEGETLHATALDGYRMAVSECPAVGASGEVKIVCPARTLTEISRMLEGGENNLKIRVGKNAIELTVGDTALTSRLYMGEFVKRENIFPPAFTTVVTVNRAEFINSVERALVLIRGDKNNLILLEIKPDLIRITANSEIGNVSETVNGELEGKELKIAMNGKFLLDALKALTEEKTILSFNTPMSPFTLANVEDKTSEYLVLPVRTNS